MNFFTIAGIVGILVIFLGIGLAFLFVRLSQMVTTSQLALEAEKSSTNPSLTLGFEIPVNADVPQQLAKARRIAAEKAAALPRGANMRIGRLGETNLRTAGKAIDQDPFTAVKIAAFHTWQGAKAGPPVGGVVQEGLSTPQAARFTPSKKPEDLVPGKDYPFIEVTDEMGANEVRSARIANARARSAAVKALKQQAEAAPAAEPVQTAAPATAEAPAPAAPAPAAAGIEEPDYIEITDDMAADEVRKARIHNARARSAYMKALKAAGIDPSQASEQQTTEAATPAPAAPEPQAAATPAAAEAEPAAAEPAPATQQAAEVEIPANIAEPDYIEITDDMSADEVRHARVHNSRERSRYFKALKDAGIDPKTVAERA